MGKFIPGRKNNPDRFKWTSKELAKAAREGKHLQKTKQEMKQEPVIKAIETPTEINSFFVTSGAKTYLNVRIPLNVSLEQLQAFISQFQQKVV